jgi:hypothetical protein
MITDRELLVPVGWRDTMTATITVEAKVLGQRKPLFTDWALALPPGWENAMECILLRDLIARIVHQEVTTFRERQAQQRLFHALTSFEIGVSAARGKVAMGGRDLDQDPDPQVAIGTALQAFEDGLYFVFVDGEQQTALDDQVQLRRDTRVTFVRLVALAGG